MSCLTDIPPEILARFQADNKAHDAAIFDGVLPLALTPQKLAKSGSEHAEQTALFAWLAFAAIWYEPLQWAYANGNGGSRGDTEQSRKIAGGMMKAEGVRKGVPDLTLPFPRLHVGSNSMFAGLYIEMKTKDGGDGGSKEQHAYIEYLQRVGYAATLCNGWIEARRTIVAYLELERRAA